MTWQLLGQAYILKAYRLANSFDDLQHLLNGEESVNQSDSFFLLELENWINWPEKVIE